MVILSLPVEEIEQMNSLFQQKQRELVLAVSKVEELTRQLEMLKNGRIDGHHDNQSAVAELDRLYKELQVGRSLSAARAPPQKQKLPRDGWNFGLEMLFLKVGGSGRPKPQEPRINFKMPQTGNLRHNHSQWSGTDVAEV